MDRDDIPFIIVIATVVIFLSIASAMTIEAGRKERLAKQEAKEEAIAVVKCLDEVDAGNKVSNSCRALILKKFVVGE